MAPVRVIQSYPDEITKVFSGEKLTFFVEVEALEPLQDYEQLINDFQLEIWTDLHCKEIHEQEENKTHESSKEFAVKLIYYKRQKNILFFKRTITPSLSGFYSYSVRYRIKTETHWSWFDSQKNYESRKIMPIYVEPEMTSSLIVYNAFVRQFGARDKNRDGVVEPGEGGTFNDLVEAMPHFKKLGINALYLNPIQKSGEVFRYQNAGKTGAKEYTEELNMLPRHMHPGSVYSIKDYKSIDPELGLNPHDETTDQYIEFKKFVKICHENHIMVFLDMVFDHTSKDSELQRLHPEWYLYKKDPLSLDYPYVRIEDDHKGEIWGKPEHIFSPFDHGIFWADCGMLNWNFRYPQAPNSAPKNPSINEMIGYFKNLLKYWVKNYGVDGFRLDVAYAIPPEFWHEAIQETREFAKGICEQHKKGEVETAPLSPEIIFIGETYVDDVAELQSCGMTCLNGDFSAKIYNVEQLKGYLDYAYNISGKFFPKGSKWFIFPECHDFNRLPKKFKGMLKNEKSDIQLGKSRWVLAALLPGIPMLHNGYEVVEHEQVSVRTYSFINWSSKKNITEYIGKVNEIRAEHTAFQKGNYIYVDSEQGITPNAQIFSFIRDYKEESERDTFLVVVNMDFNKKADHVKIHLPSVEGYNFNRPYIIKDLLTNTTYERSSEF
ncbi:MAG: alpha-amylase family glycosyl hydrolase, partial [Candidatus Woesearchaeota archaeon]